MSFTKNGPLFVALASRNARKLTIIGGLVFALILIFSTSRPSSKTTERFRAAYSSFKNPHIEAGVRPEPIQINSRPEDIKLSSESETTDTVVSGHGKNKYSATLVSGRMDKDASAVDWIHNDLNDMNEKAIYIVDNPSSSSLHLEKNHGREAMVYLTYIVDNYDSLSDVTFFFHTDDKVWHNNLLLNESSVQAINRMNRSLVIDRGYVNTRCDHWPGCPSWVTFNPAQAEHALDPHKLSDMFSEKLFRRLFPDEEEYPRYFAQTCCSQFAASRDAIRNVPLAEWKRIKQWISDEWADQYTGRAMEMMWQYIFLREGEHCPRMETCYCEQYGLCFEDDKKGKQLLNKWNQYRTRSEELQWQEWFRMKELHADTSKTWNYNERDDEEFARVNDERLSVRKKAVSYKEEVVKHFGLVESEVEW